jgi:hypothetical protein
MIRSLTACCLLLLCAPAVPAEAPPPIRLLLTPARPPTPALRYRLLPDARLALTGDAAVVYQQIIERLATKPVAERELLSEWLALPLPRLPTKDVRQELAAYDDVYELLDRAARCDHCDWGVRERLRRKGMGALLPEIQPLRECALLLAVRARLEMADGHPDRALATLRSGFALARHTGDAETLIHFLVGTAVAANMANQLDALIARPDAPNLYYALTDLPVPFLSPHKGLAGERLGTYGTFPGLGAIATDLAAGSLPERDLTRCVAVVSGLLNDGVPIRSYAERVVLGWTILSRHDLARQALVDAGRPRDTVEAMPPVQVALLHALLEYDAMIDDLLVGQGRPPWELSDRVLQVTRRYRADRGNNPAAAAIPLAGLLLPAVQKITAARVRLERKVALLRTIEAIRFYAATHGGKLPVSLHAIKEVPVPLDPATGRDFAYRLDGAVARLSAPPPAQESPNVGNSVAYELTVRE